MKHINKTERTIATIQHGPTKPEAPNNFPHATFTAYVTISFPLQRLSDSKDACTPNSME